MKLFVFDLNFGPWLSGRSLGSHSLEGGLNECERASSIIDGMSIPCGNVFAAVVPAPRMCGVLT